MKVSYVPLARQQRMRGRYDPLRRATQFLGQSNHLPSEDRMAKLCSLAPHLRQSQFRPPRSWWGMLETANKLAAPPTAPPPAPKGLASKGVISGAVRAAKSILGDEEYDVPLPPSFLGGYVIKAEKYWRSCDL